MLSLFPNMNPSPRRRSDVEHYVFFGLRPEERSRKEWMAEQGRRLREHYGLRGTCVPLDCLHLSLVGIVADTEPPAPWLVEFLDEAVANVPSAPFEIELDRPESFERQARKKALVLTETRRTEALDVLHDRLCKALAKAGLRPHRGFSRPHVTLSYGEPLPKPVPIRPIPLLVQEFCLIHSHRGRSRHEVLGRWPLRGWN